MKSDICIHCGSDWKMVDNKPTGNYKPCIALIHWKNNKISTSTLQDFNILGMSRKEFGEYAVKQGEDWRKNNPELMDAYNASNEQFTGTLVNDLENKVQKQLDKHGI